MPDRNLVPGDAALGPTIVGTVEGPPMTAHEISHYLTEVRIARLATSRDGEPRVIPVWYDWDGISIWIETGLTFPVVETLRRNPRGAVAIDDSFGGLRIRGVVMRGHVELMAGPKAFVDEVVRRIYVRYLGAEALDAPTPRAMLATPHMLLKLTPTTMASWDRTLTGLAPL